MLDVEIKTGRKNQIRVQLSDINHPILGDMKYGDKKSRYNRLFLHANYLAIKNYKTKKIMEFESKVPKEFNNLFL